MVLSDLTVIVSPELPDYNTALAMPTANVSPPILHTNSIQSPPVWTSPRNQQLPLVPSDWEERNRDGKRYYADLTTKKTHWPPPTGWRVKKHTDGRIYYVHIPTKSSHWYLPPPNWEVCTSPGGNVYFFDTKTKEMHTKVPPPANPDVITKTNKNQPMSSKKKRS